VNQSERELIEEFVRLAAERSAAYRTVLRHGKRIREMVPDLYRIGVTTGELNRAAGISGNEICARLDAAGIPARRAGRRRGGTDAAIAKRRKRIWAAPPEEKAPPTPLTEARAGSVDAPHGGHQSTPKFSGVWWTGDDTGKFCLTGLTWGPKAD
jgi:hypothetical protein